MNIERGDEITWKGYERVKVMAVADGYAMLRRPSCMPFIKSLKDLEKLGSTKR